MKRHDVTEVSVDNAGICRVKQNTDDTWTACITDEFGNTSLSVRATREDAISAAKEHYQQLRTGT